MFKKFSASLSVLMLCLFLFAGNSLAALSTEATAAQTAVTELITDMSGLGWTIASAMVVAMAGIGLFLKFVRKGGAR